jgi:hypothetical protein
MGDNGGFVLIGPAGWQIIGLATLMAIGWWLTGRAGKNRPPSTLGLFLRALAWQLLPALATWRERARAYAVKRFAEDDVSDEGGELVEPTPVLADTYQPGSGARSDSEEVVEEPELNKSLRKLSDTDVIALLAVQRNSDGGYRFSANKIVELVGGTRAETLDKIRQIREPTTPASSSAHPPTAEFRTNAEIAAFRRRMGLPTHGVARPKR